MQLKNKCGRKYLSEVKRQLKCAGKLRRGFLDILKNELYNFELSRPDADCSDYTAAFGTAEETAQACLSELSRRERAAYWFPFAAVLGAVVISVFLFISALLMAQWEDRDSYMVVSDVCVVSSSDAPEYYD